MNNNWISPKPDLLPDFIIGGAMKCGTTTLHAILNKHPKIFIPKDEVHFFDMDNILQHGDFNFYHKGKWISQDMDKNPKLVWDWYQDKFKGKENLVKGEDSTTYLASRSAAERISAQNKEIKMVFLLRQPSSRSYSNYNHLLRTGRATYSFEDTLRFNPHDVINRSMYKEQLEVYYKYFPKDRIKVILFEDLLADPKSVVDEVCAFIGLDPAEMPADAASTHANKGQAPGSSKLQAKKNRILRNFGNLRYNNSLPFKGPKAGQSNSILARIVEGIHNIINPLSSVKTKINPETKVLLDKFYYQELQGLNELVGRDVLSRWFPNENPK